MWNSVRSSSAPPHPEEACREQRLHDGWDGDPTADSSSPQLEDPEAREHRARSANAKTHRRAKIRWGSRSPEEEQEGEAEVERTDPATHDKKAVVRVDAPFLKNGSPGKDEA